LQIWKHANIYFDTGKTPEYSVFQLFDIAVKMIKSKRIHILEQFLRDLYAAWKSPQNETDLEADPNMQIEVARNATDTDGTEGKEKDAGPSSRGQNDGKTKGKERDKTALEETREIENKTVPELRAMLKEMGIASSGNKQTLIDRIVEHKQQNEEVADNETSEIDDLVNEMLDLADCLDYIERGHLDLAKKTIHTWFERRMQQTPLLVLLRQMGLPEICARLPFLPLRNTLGSGAVDKLLVITQNERSEQLETLLREELRQCRVFKPQMEEAAVRQFLLSKAAQNFMRCSPGESKADALVQVYVKKICTNNLWADNVKKKKKNAWSGETYYRITQRQQKRFHQRG